MSETTAAAPAAETTTPATSGSVLGDALPPAGAPEKVDTVVPPPAPEAPVVPEAYDFAAPEGFTVDDAAVDGYKTLAREMGLSQEQFAKLSGYGIEQLKAATAAPAAAWQAMQSEWVGQVAADPELGMVDGKLAPEAAQHVARVAQAYGTPELMQALALTGAGNHPAVIKAFVAIGKAMGAAGPLDQGKPAPATRQGNSFGEIASRLYPTMQSAGA